MRAEGFGTLLVVWFCFWWHPRGVIGLHALPLCGAAPTLSATLVSVCVFAGILGLTLWRSRFGFLALALASALRCSPFTRRPCAGRHLLFFAAAKKSRQKKAAHTANISSCLRAPNRSLTSHGNLLVQRSLPALLRCASPALRARVAARRARYSTAAQVANCV